MALNLAATLRAAVDGPCLDELVGEDPADLDLPALSARIRHRRRRRAATRSAVGVAAAGAVALAGVHGLDRRGVESSGTVAAVPGGAELRLCGLDVATMPAVAGPRLAPTSAPVTVDTTGAAGVDGALYDLGTFAGRTLTAIQVAPAGSTTGDVVLTRDDTVVAVGTVHRDLTLATDDERSGGTTGTAQVVSSDLSACPAMGTSGPVPAGSYAVQYVMDRGGAAAATPGAAATGLVRSSAGSWTVTLLDDPAAVALPAGFPADEVPVVGGTLLAATEAGATAGGPPTTWTVMVASEGDDAMTRAATSLRAAGAVVSDGLGFVVSNAGSSTADAPLPGATPGDPKPALLATLAARQAAAEAAEAAVVSAQQTYDGLVRAQASADSLQWAARTLQAARDEAANAAQRLALAQADLPPGPQPSSAAGGPPTAVTYVLTGPGVLTATTRSWMVTVTRSEQSSRTVLTYSLTRG